MSPDPDDCVHERTAPTDGGSVCLRCGQSFAARWAKPVPRDDPPGSTPVGRGLEAVRRVRRILHPDPEDTP